MTTSKEQIQKAAHNIRIKVLKHTIHNNGGYMSQACSSAEILATLYLELMKLSPVERPLAPKPFPGVPSKSNKAYFTGADFNGGHSFGFDRFYLSPAHYALVLYTVLIESGRMSADGLDHFNQDGSSVEMIGAEHSPGMEVTTGSLGQGISQAAGSALVRKRKLDPGIQWIFMSDGEFQIGQTWEALQVMKHYCLDNIKIFVDVNGQQCDGKMEDVMNIEPLDERLRSFGAKVLKVNGHDVEALIQAGRSEHQGVPLVVLCYTDACKGLERFRKNSPKLHYLRFKNRDERLDYEKILSELEG